jgi:hypothetical protein
MPVKLKIAWDFVGAIDNLINQHLGDAEPLSERSCWRAGYESGNRGEGYFLPDEGVSSAEEFAEGFLKGRAEFEHRKKDGMQHRRPPRVGPPP